MGCCQSYELQEGVPSPSINIQKEISLTHGTKKLRREASAQGQKSSSWWIRPREPRNDDSRRSIVTKGVRGAARSRAPVGLSSPSGQTVLSSTSSSGITSPEKSLNTPTSKSHRNSAPPGSSSPLSFEYKAYHAVMNTSRTDQTLQQRFNSFDVQSRGYITCGNLRAVLGNENNVYIQYLIQQADQDKDGIIYFKEFEKVMETWKNSFDETEGSTEGHSEGAEDVCSDCTRISSPPQCVNTQYRSTLSPEDRQQRVQKAMSHSEKVANSSYRSQYQQAVQRANQRFDTIDISFSSP